MWVNRKNVTINFWKIPLIGLTLTTLSSRLLSIDACLCVVFFMWDCEMFVAKIWSQIVQVLIWQRHLRGWWNHTFLSVVLRSADPSWRQGTIAYCPCAFLYSCPLRPSRTPTLPLLSSLLKPAAFVQVAHWDFHLWFVYTRVAWNVGPGHNWSCTRVYSCMQKTAQQ